MDSQKSENQEKIQLTELELAMMKKDIAGEFFPPEATDEERKALALRRPLLLESKTLPGE